MTRIKRKRRPDATTKPAVHQPMMHVKRKRSLNDAAHKLPRR